MSSISTTLFKNVLFRLFLVYSIWFGYSALWRWFSSGHSNWDVAVIVAGGMSGLVALALAMTSKFGQPLLRDRLYNALPVSIGSLAIVSTLILFPSAFCKLWFTGFLLAMPVPVVVLLVLAIRRRAAKAVTAVTSPAARAHA